MSGKMNRWAYVQCIQEDLNVMMKHMPHSLERDHIINVLVHSVDVHYPNSETKLIVRRGSTPGFDVCIFEEVLRT